MDFNPGGVLAISRGLRSGATTPPVRRRKTSTPAGVAAKSNRSEATAGAGIPAGMQTIGSGSPTGGVAALNHRLIAVKPPASRPPEAKWFNDNTSCQNFYKPQFSQGEIVDGIARSGQRGRPPRKPKPAGSRRVGTTARMNRLTETSQSLPPMRRRKRYERQSDTGRDRKFDRQTR